MKKWLSDVKTNKFIIPILVLLVASFFLALPASAAGPIEEYTIQFWADRAQIAPGECVNIYWNTNNVQTVYYNNQPVSGIQQSRLECPSQSTVYNLVVTTRTGQQIVRQIYVEVTGQPGYPNYGNYGGVFVEFLADRTWIRAGECVNIYWNTNNVQTVYYNNQPVSGIQQNRVECPRQSTTYNLVVTTRTNQQVVKQIYVQVFGSVSEQGELRMENGQMVDADRQGRVSTNEDDFRWVWTGGEGGNIVKASNDDDLKLAVVTGDDADNFDGLSQDDCRDWLDDDDQVSVGEGSVVCFRSDDGHVGKFRVQDIGRNTGQLVLDWGIWK